MGRGGAQLGKSVKGKSKRGRRLLANGGGVGGNGRSDRLIGDVSAFELYDQLSALSRAHRQRMTAATLNEYSHSAITHAAIVQTFRDASRSAKAESVAAELYLFADSTANALADKNERIAALDQTIAHCHAQLLTSQRQHMRRVGALVSSHAKHIRTLKTHYERVFERIKDDFDARSKRIVGVKSSQLAELQYVINHIDTATADFAVECAQRHETEREELRNRNLESINELRLTLEGRIDDLSRMFDESYRGHSDATKATSEHFAKLKNDDAALSLAVDEKKKKISKLIALIAHWRSKAAANAVEGDQRNAQLKRSRDHIAAECAAIKATMANFRRGESDRLRRMIVMAKATAETTNGHIAIAEDILNAAQIIRKLQTENDRVRPLSPPQSAPLPPSDVGLLSLVGMNGDLTDAFDAAGRAVPCTNALSALLIQYNAAAVDVNALKRESQRLTTENNQLRNILAHFINGIAVTTETIGHDDAPNSLLIVNGRAPVLPHSRGPPKTIQMCGVKGARLA